MREATYLSVLGSGLLSGFLVTLVFGTLVGGVIAARQKLGIDFDLFPERSTGYAIAFVVIIIWWFGSLAGVIEESKGSVTNGKKTCKPLVRAGVAGIVLFALLAGVMQYVALVMDEDEVTRGHGSVQVILAFAAIFLALGSMLWFIEPKAIVAFLLNPGGEDARKS